MQSPKSPYDPAVGVFWAHAPQIESFEKKQKRYRVTALLESKEQDRRIRECSSEFQRQQERTRSLWPEFVRALHMRFPERVNGCSRHQGLPMDTTSLSENTNNSFITHLDSPTFNTNFAQNVKNPSPMSPTKRSRAEKLEIGGAKFRPRNYSDVSLVEFSMDDNSYVNFDMDMELDHNSDIWDCRSTSSFDLQANDLVHALDDLFAQDEAQENV